MSRTYSRQEIAVSKLTEFYELVGDLLVKTTRRSRRIQLTIIVLTVLTTGTLWGLISASFEIAAAWSGAVATTVLSFLALYQATIGPESKLKDVRSIYDAAGEYLAQIVDADEFDYSRFADTLRRFELRVREIETEHAAAGMRAMLVAPRYDYGKIDHVNSRIKNELLREVNVLQRTVEEHEARAEAKGDKGGAL